MRLIRSYRKFVERAPSVPVRSMKEELAAVELYGSELGQQDSSDYMFNKPDEVDYDAFHERYLSRLALGCDTDAPTFFDRIDERLGYACRQENAPQPVPSDSETT